MGGVAFTALAALGQMELEIRSEPINQPVSKRRTSSGDFGGSRPTYTDSQFRTAARLIQFV